MEAVTGSPPDVIAYTAAIGCCAEAGEWKRAFSLLNEMQTSRYHLQPNVMTYSTVISSCANALAKITDSKEKKVILGAALQLLETMKESKYPESQPNIVSYNAAIRTCAEAQDLEGAFRLMDEVISRGLTPTIVTFGSLMTACERVGSVDDMNLVFELLNQFNENRLDTEQIKPNEIIYGAAISCCRKAAQSDRAVQLLKKMIKAGLSPNTATFNTVIMALTEGKYPDIDKALSVFKVMNSQNCAPNRQTFNVIIRSLAASQRPADAEVFLTNMSTAGFTPDVDLYTITVTCYEKNREPMKALQLMESMRERGYDFYDIKVVNEAFKKAIKLVNVVGRRFS
jgi:pentatricopeptide repeat protein